ncbi:MAG: hypothetical protein WC241_03860 [Candidatus Paceibacterota bacterium]|jgi:hypothetical protein
MKKIEWTLNSRYAVVSCFSKNGLLWVEKVISTDNTDIQNPRWVNEVSECFRQKLSFNKVPLASPYLFEEKENFSIQTSPYIGPDIEKFFSLNRLNKRNKLLIVEKVIAAMSGILFQGTDLEVGIDPRLSNFCVNKDGSIYYVDTFPPLVKYNGEYVVHFPNPTSSEIITKEITRKFNPYGIIRRFRFSILEQDYSLTEKDILLAIKNVLGKNFSIDVGNYFAALPREFTNKSDVDTIREIAISKASNKTGKDRESFLTNIFELSSSFGSLNLSMAERLERINELLK